MFEFHKTDCFLESDVCISLSRMFKNHFPIAVMKKVLKIVVCIDWLVLMIDTRRFTDLLFKEARSMIFARVEGSVWCAQTVEIRLIYTNMSQRT